MPGGEWAAFPWGAWEPLGHGGVGWDLTQAVVAVVLLKDDEREQKGSMTCYGGDKNTRYLPGSQLLWK